MSHGDSVEDLIRKDRDVEKVVLARRSASITEFRPTEIARLFSTDAAYRERAAKFMRGCGVDALVATSPVNITYFSDHACWLDPLFAEQTYDVAGRVQQSGVNIRCPAV